MEEQILKLLDKIEDSNNDITDGWYPTIAELESHITSDKKVEKYLSLICYFSTDPLKIRAQDYLDAVSWCRHKLYELL